MLKVKQVMMCYWVAFFLVCGSTQFSLAGEDITLYKSLNNIYIKDKNKDEQSKDKDKRQTKWIIIVDLSKESASKIISVPSDTPLTSEIGSIDNLIKLMSDLGQENRERWVSKKGDSLKIFIIHPKNITANVSFKEIGRQTRLESDIKTLYNIILSKSKRMAMAPAPSERAESELVLTIQDYTLTKVRSTLSVSIDVSDVSGTETIAGVGTLNLITGPMEHWYLSADYPVNDVSPLKYNSESKTIETVDKEIKPLLGINYQIGDILNDDWELGDVWQGLSLKFLAEISSHPENTLAIGIGYRVPPINVYGFSLATVSPFVAYSRVKNDVLRSNLSVDEGGKTKWKWIAGISLNLDKAMDWIASSSDQKN